MLRQYRKALNYAHRLDPQYYKDLVHDAYLEWYRKTGMSLLEAPEGVMIQTIKNTHRGNYTRSTFMWRGEIGLKQFFTFQEYDRPVNEFNPENQCIIMDMKEKLDSRLTEEQREVLNQTRMGYAPSEVAEQLGTYRQQINYKMRVITNIYRELN